MATAELTVDGPDSKEPRNWGGGGGRRIVLPFLLILVVTDGEIVEEHCCILLHCVCCVIWHMATETTSGDLEAYHSRRGRTSFWATSKGKRFAHARSTPCLPIASSVASWVCSGCQPG